MTRYLALGLVAQLLAGAAAAQVPEEPLGRLFFTPEQRAALDAGRRIATKKGDSKPARARGPKSVELNGIILRSDGMRTVWVNGKPHHDSSPRNVQVEVDAKAPDSAIVQFSGRRSARVRVGEKIKLRPLSESPAPEDKDSTSSPALQHNARETTESASGRSPAPDPASTETETQWPR